MARAPRTPRAPRGQPTPRRSHAGRIAAAALGTAYATAVGWGLNQAPSPTPPQPSAPAAAAPLVPDPDRTPGATDPNIKGAEVCAHDWAPGAPSSNPPVKGGKLTYSQAARHTSASLKEKVFATYGVANPHDGGISYEIDHRIPLSLGGRDVLQNLWPQTRTAPAWNAWVKDRLELRLYNLLCHPRPGDPKVTLAQIQTALRGDWRQAFDTWCADEEDCPVGGGQSE